MLSAALLFSTLSRTPGAGGVSAADVDRRIQQAVYASEARQTAKTTQLVHDLAQQSESEHKLRLVAESEVEYAKKREYAMERSRGEWVSPASN